MKTGVELIAEEIKRQSNNGYSLDHYLNVNDGFTLENAATATLIGNPAAFPDELDDDVVVNICNRSKYDRLIIAGTFIARQIDVIQKKSSYEKTTDII